LFDVRVTVWVTVWEMAGPDVRGDEDKVATPGGTAATAGMS